MKQFVVLINIAAVEPQAAYCEFVGGFNPLGVSVAVI